MSAGAPRKRDLLSLFDLGDGETVRALVRRGLELKRRRREGSNAGAPAEQPLRGKTVGMIFEKASTRTRVSFEVATFELGGHAVYLTSQGSQIGRGEPLRDTARVLGAYCHAIVVRTFGQQVVEELARFAPVPVINGLTDLLHPTQVLADLMTVEELRGAQALDPGRLRFAWIGDANNMAHSWMNAAALLGLDLYVAHPAGRDPDAEVLRRAQALALRTGGRITLSHDVRAAAEGRHVLSTDVWASMGDEPDSEAAQAELQRRFAGFCIDEGLLQLSAADAMVLHCLPAHRGEEITDAVLEGPRSAVFVQAENRLHMSVPGAPPRHDRAGAAAGADLARAAAGLPRSARGAHRGRGLLHPGVAGAHRVAVPPDAGAAAAPLRRRRGVPPALPRRQRRGGPGAHAGAAAPAALRHRLSPG